MPERTIPESAVIVVAEGVLASDFGAEQVILNLRDGIYYGLEDVGSRIWQLLQRPTTVPALRATLVEEYDVEPDRCERDLLALIADLSARGLVTIRERP
ncbi:MAG: PqqD family peptide modification chaperone [Gemmatimonadales bacterium]